MPPANALFTDNTTYINSFGMAFTILMGLLVIVIPRRYAIVPVLALVCYMTMGMRVMVGGLNFTMIRILLIFCWLRLICRGEYRRISLGEIDKALLWFIAASVFAHTLLLGSDGFKYKSGQAYDALGFFFFFRMLFREWEDVLSIPGLIAILLVPLSLEMVNEKLSQINSFALFGGVSPEVILRDGTVRAQGPFGHPILAGSFGVTMMPLMVGLWMRGGKARPLALIGLIAATTITACAGSSGPIMAYAFGVLALAHWKMRDHLKWLRRGVSITLIVLHLSMKAPVWFLIGRFSVFDASTGFHRAFLIDRCIVNFSGWWLYGTTSFGEWGYYLFDRTNHYVCLATDGGLLTVVLFMMIISRCFRAVGTGIRWLKESCEPGSNTPQAWFVWSLGAVLMIHCVTFLSCTYFDQNMINWYFLLALISSVYSMNQAHAAAEQPPPESVPQVELPSAEKLTPALVWSRSANREMPWTRPPAQFDGRILP